MKLEPEHRCPLNNFEPCQELKCAWFTQLRGKDPQSEKDIDEWGCAISWLPVLLVENSQMQRQTGSAVESFRNKMIEANENSQKILLATTQLSQLQRSVQKTEKTDSLIQSKFDKEE